MDLNFPGMQLEGNTDIYLTGMKYGSSLINSEEIESADDKIYL